MLGVLDVQSIEEAAFTEEDIAALQVLADQVAVALDNARLFAESQAALEAERRAYGELSYQAWIDLLQAHPSQGYRYDQSGLAPLNGHVSTPEAEDRGHVSDTSPTGTCGLPELMLPVNVRGHRIASITAHKPGEAGEWSAGEVAIMETLAEQLSLALESARLYQDTQRRAAREQLIGEVTARMRETLDVKAVLETAADQIYRTLELETVVIQLATDKTNDLG
jgi:GAF domain-containing protein